MSEDRDETRGRKKEFPITKHPGYESSFTTNGKTFNTQDALWTAIETMSKTQVKNNLFDTIVHEAWLRDNFATKTNPTRRSQDKRRRKERKRVPIVKRY